MIKHLFIAFMLCALPLGWTHADEPAKPANAEVSTEHVAQSKEGLQLFKNHVRQILEKHCLDCHGGKSTKADFNLASRKLLMDSGFVEKTAGESYVMELIRHEAEPEMPFKAEKLSDKTIALIAKWIDLGAPYDKPLVEHAESKTDVAMQVSETDRDFWSFRPLAESDPRRVPRDSWSRTPVDRFVFAKLHEKDITPNSDAERRTLIRRASLDLIGMPPSAEEVEAFVNDRDPGAFEKVIDRLLESQHYGERWARHWLDVARFAESTGFEHDYDRNSAYHYRDFLIQAFNADMPWDQMVRWQLAGDELAPDNRLALMATGFMAAGVFPTQLTEAEFESARYDELDDIVATTGVAFLGLSTGCARCHDHKFDPIPTRDYYGLAATFATTIRSEMQVEFGHDEYQADLKRWNVKRAEIEAAFQKYEADVFEPEFADWLLAPTIPPEAEDGSWSVLSSSTAKSRGGAKLEMQPDGSWVASGKSPNNDEYTIEADVASGVAALRIEALTDSSLSKNGPGRATNGNFALGDLVVEAQAIGDSSKKKTRVALRNPRATHQQNKTNLSVASSIDADVNTTGWAVDFGGIGKDQAAIFEFAEPLDARSRLVIRMRFHVNTKHSLGRFRISTSRNPKSDFELGVSRDDELAKALMTLKSLGASKLPDSQRQRIRQWYASRNARWLDESNSLETHIASRPKPDMRTVLVCSEGVKPVKHHADGRGYPHFYPDVHLLLRGDTKQKQEVMQAGFLQVLESPQPQEILGHGEATTGKSYRRSRLARWITDPRAGAGRLAARVIVNRLWQHHFGEGIVSTPNDFGFQGARPTHADLLDWLASDLIAHGWKLKRMHKLLMTSSVYRQGSQSDANRSAADVDNRFLWHYRTRRLEAEAIRDSLLRVSAQLDPTMFGPGSLNENTRRRSVYFTIKRSRFVPMMQVFDWPEHLVSIGKRTNTAIAPQALALMNGPQVRAYAEALAKGICRSHATVESRVEATYQRVFTRPATRDEVSLATTFLKNQAARYSPDADGETRAMIDFCQVLFCSNEFLYLP